MTRSSRSGRTWRAAAALTALALTAAACSGDDDGDETTTAPSTAPAGDTTAPAGDTTAPGSGIDPERCAANQAAGTITYASSFDFAAAASIVDVVVAKEKGYFEALCLDVELVPGFSTSNYPLVTAGTAVPPRTLWTGSPARQRRPLEAREIAFLAESAAHYVALKDHYLA